VFRIRVLGLLTFAVTIVYMVCASVSTAQILAWAPYFFDFFTCESLDVDCGGCPANYATALTTARESMPDTASETPFHCWAALRGPGRGA